MASVVGHAFAGLIVKQAFHAEVPPQRRRWLPIVFVLLALLPDLDIVIYALAKPAGMIPHRGISHGLPFVVLTAGIFALLTYEFFGIAKGKLFVFYSCSLSSHLVLDFLMGAGPKLPLLAPFSYVGFLSPISLIPWAYYSSSPKGLLQLFFHQPTLVGICLELLIFLPLSLSFRPNQPPARRAILVLASVLAVAYTIWAYN